MISFARRRREPPPPKDPRGPPMRFRPGFAAILFLWSACFLPFRDTPVFAGAFVVQCVLLAAGCLRVRPLRWKESDFRLFFLPVFALALGYAVFTPVVADPALRGSRLGRTMGFPLGLHAALVVPVFTIVLRRFATRTRLLVAGAVLPWVLAIPLLVLAVLL